MIRNEKRQPVNPSTSTVNTASSATSSARCCRTKRSTADNKANPYSKKYKSIDEHDCGPYDTAVVRTWSCSVRRPSSSSIKSSGLCSRGAARLSREEEKVEGVHPAALPTCAHQSDGISTVTVFHMFTNRQFQQCVDNCIILIYIIIAESRRCSCSVVRSGKQILYFSRPIPSNFS